jgi:hypothetical protein
MVPRDRTVAAEALNRAGSAGSLRSPRGDCAAGVSRYEHVPSNFGVDTAAEGGEVVVHG